jgi:hypothetical protein
MAPASSRYRCARIVSPVLDFDDPNFERRKYHLWVAYGQSKTGNVRFAVAFDRSARSMAGGRSLFIPGTLSTQA